MIPTMLLLGLVAGMVLTGRWTWSSIPVLGLVWGLLVAAQPQPEIGPILAFLGAVPLGMVNAGIGVLVGKGLRDLGTKLADRWFGGRRREEAP